MKSKVIVAESFILVIALVSLLFISIQIIARKTSDEKAERIIQSYIKAKDLNIQINTEEYSRLMKGILLGEHQDLVGKTSPFIETQDDVDLIIDYAARHMKKLESDSGTDIPEALTQSLKITL